MTAPIRTRLPNRRHLVTRTIAVEGLEVQVAIGRVKLDGPPGEVFIAAGKPGSALAHILDDAATVISLALQYGIPPAALQHAVAPTGVLGRALGLILVDRIKQGRTK